MIGRSSWTSLRKVMTPNTGDMSPLIVLSAVGLMSVDGELSVEH